MAKEIPRQLDVPPEHAAWLPTSIDAHLELPECRWRAGEDIEQRKNVAPNDIVCCSPRIHQRRDRSITHPVRGSIIPSTACQGCIFRNEEFNQREYDSLMRGRWGGPQRRPPWPVLVRRLFSDLRFAIKKAWRDWRSPATPRPLYNLRLETCSGCEVAQPPVETNYCSDCGCRIPAKAAVEASLCPKHYWPGQAMENVGAELRARSPQEAQALRQAYADATVAVPREDPPRPPLWRLAWKWIVRGVCKLPGGGCRRKKRRRD